MSIFPDRESSSDVEVDYSTRQFQTILASNELRRERSINERILGVNMVIVHVLTSFVKVKVI